jgi:hypothetical protein
MAGTEGVDVTAAVATLDGTIASLRDEIERDDEALRVKKARLNALLKGRKGLEAAASDDIAPVRRPGRKKSETQAA